MNFSDTEITVLQNFAKINPSQIIKPDGLGAKELSNLIVGTYKFENEYDFEPFGIYDVNMFLQAISTFDKPNIDVKADRLVITEGNGKVTYFTTPLDLIKTAVVPDLNPKFNKITCEIDFDLSADKLATINKTEAVFKAGYLFIESESEDAVRLTVSSEEPGSSANSFDLVVRENVRMSNLPKGEFLKIPLTELRIIPGDYTVLASTKKITKWSSFLGVEYFVGCMIK